MLDLLTHLWPDFSQLFSGNAIGISGWFWLLTSGIFICSISLLGRHYFRFKKRLKALLSLLEGQSREALANDRRETLQKAQRLTADKVGMLWQEFDESLVISSDKKQLFNTLDAEYFFNARTLAMGLTSSRLLAATPSFLVAIGVLGTFVGLTIGLGGLVDSTAEIETLKSGIDKLISGASVAFMTSVWGVTFSLLLNFIEKLFERNALIHIQNLQNKVDFLYPRIPAEQSLVHIAEHSKESKEALQELHERIGDRLQESITGISEAMQSTLTDTLNNIMGPAIKTLIASTSQQSNQAMENLVGSFMEGMNSAGRVQGEQLEKVALDVNTAVSNMSERFEHLFSKLNAQQASSLSAQEDQFKRFQQQFQQLTNSADEQQSQLEGRFGKMMSDLAHQHNQQQTDFLDQQQTILGSLGAASKQQIDIMTSAVQKQQGAFQDTVSKLMETVTQQGTQADTREQVRQEKFQLQLDEMKQQQQAMQLAQLAQQQKMLESLGAGSQRQIEVMTSATQQQQSSLQDAFGKLMETVTQQGAEADSREQVRQDKFQQQLEAVTLQQQELLSTITKSVQASQQQSQQMAEQHQQLLTRLREVTGAAAQTSKHMDNSANQLGLLSTNVRSAAELLGQRLEQVTQRIEDAGSQNGELTVQLKHQAEMLAGLQDSLLKGAERFEQAAGDARNGFGEMKQTQQEFLSGVKTEFNSLGEALRSQVEAIEKQAEQWLQKYASEVSSQVHDRMDQWNQVSLEYANKMYHTAEAMSSVLDELEQR